MKYMGSKNRHAKDLLPMVLANRRADQWYVEPFVGGFNMIDKVGGNRLANDSHPYLIALFRAIQAGWCPPGSVSEETYASVRTSKHDYPAHLVGFVGFGCSYSGKWFGGYARGNAANGAARNYCEESRRNILRQVAKIQGVEIHCGAYHELQVPERSLVYCDPPYAGTTKYKGSFDHAAFWKWVRCMSAAGHDMFVSEYRAPEDFECVWSKTIHNTLVRNTGAKQGCEKLFVPRREPHGA